MWDPNGQRFTLTFDPGRIKRGLEANQKMGPPIADGQRYTLVIDREWPDARGVPLVEAYRKTFRGGPAVRVPPDPARWKVSPPRAGTREPVVVDFDRPMNYPLLQRMIQIASARGRVVGATAVDRQESQWRFTPGGGMDQRRLSAHHRHRPRGSGREQIGQPFDIDVFDRVTEHLTTTTVDVPFTVQ